MKLAHLVFLFACIAFPMYMIGYTSPFLQLFSQSPAGTPLDVATIISQIASNMTNIAFAANVFLLALGIAALSGFSAVYIIPALILSIAVNFVLIPSSFLLGGQCSSPVIGTAALCLPAPISIVLTTFLNLLVFLCILEYIRGGG